MQAGLSFAAAGLQHGCTTHFGVLIGWNKRLERVEGALTDAGRG